MAAYVSITHLTIDTTRQCAVNGVWHCALGYKQCNGIIMSAVSRTHLHPCVHSTTQREGDKQSLRNGSTSEENNITFLDIKRLYPCTSFVVYITCKVEPKSTKNKYFCSRNSLSFLHRYRSTRCHCMGIYSKTRTSFIFGMV